MKRMAFIGFLLVFVACAQRNADDSLPVETPHIESLRELSAIDSLMWQQPDSALTRFISYFDTCIDAKTCVSTASEYNRHYAQLLLAELLYKNDYAQTNRCELLHAVEYFDSLLLMVDTRGGVLQPNQCRDVRRASAKNIAQTVAFLDARIHYINGVGYYERDSIMEACKEYLKALEIMEKHFKENELKGVMARFMTYTYNRLLDLFSAQYMPTPAIFCCEQSLTFYKIAPTSPYGVSNTLLRLGMQYDIIREKDKAKRYYEQAIETLPDTNNLVYRDIVSIKALCDYQLGMEIGQTLMVLKSILALANDEDELLTRYLTIGDILFEEGMYDSALYYLKLVFENNTDMTSRIQAADYLHVIYDKHENIEESNACVRFLADYRKPEGQNKTLVSQLEDLFQNYMKQKQGQKALQETKKAVSKTVNIAAPVIVFVCVSIIFIIKHRNKRRMETELLTHRMEKAALSGRLKQKNKEVRKLKEQIKQQDDLVIKTERVVSFTDESICRLIMERVKEGQFLSQMDCTIYKDYALDKNQLSALRKAVNHHFGQFTVRISKAHPELTKGDIDYCCLYLLNLSDADIAALMQRAYNTVNERKSKLKRIFGSKNSISITLQAIANDFVNN